MPAQSANVRKTNVRKTYDSTWDFEIKNDDSPAKLTLAYTDDFVGWAKNCPVLGSDNPDIPGLVLDTIKGKRVDGDQIVINLNYEGTSDEAPGRTKKDPISLYDVEVSTTEEHLLTHSHYNALTEVERRGLQAICNGQELDEAGCPWDPALTGELAQHALTRIRKGFVSVIVRKIVYVQKTTTKVLTDLHLDLVGKKTDIPGPWTGLYPGHWLYLGAPATANKDGKSWALERRWLFSPDEWDTLYDPPA